MNTKHEIKARIAKARDDSLTPRITEGHERDEACRIVLALLKLKQWPVRLEIGMFDRQSMNIAMVDENDNEIRPGRPPKEDDLELEQYNQEAMDDVVEYLQSLGATGTTIDSDSGVIVPVW